MWCLHIQTHKPLYFIVPAPHRALIHKLKMHDTWVSLKWCTKLSVCLFFHTKFYFIIHFVVSQRELGNSIPAVMAAGSCVRCPQLCASHAADSVYEFVWVLKVYMAKRTSLIYRLLCTRCALNVNCFCWREIKFMVGRSCHCIYTDWVRIEWNKYERSLRLTLRM